MGNTAHDESDLQKRLKKLAIAEGVFEVSLDPIIVIDGQGIISQWNQAAEKLFGFAHDEAIGRNITIIIPTPHDEMHDSYLTNYLNGGEACVIGSGREVQAQRRNGDILDVHLSVTKIDIDSGIFFVGMVRDMTKAKQQEKDLLRFVEELDEAKQYSEAEAGKVVALAEELAHDKSLLKEQEAKLQKNEAELKLYIQDIEMTRNSFEQQAAEMVGLAEQLHIEKEKVEESSRIIEYQANHDALTGLGNRTKMKTALPNMIESAHQANAKVGFIYIDLDNFKPVNDKLGHDAGDKLLCDVSKAITEALRDRDLAIRLGGDEFAALIWLDKGQGRSELMQAAKRILAALQITVEGPDCKIETGASIGVALYPDDGTTPDEVLSASDNAMYEAKRGGKNRIA